jgi:putative copper export protein
VPALFIAGSALALWFGGGVAGLFGSAYGLAIGAKLLLATTALCVGAWNRLSLVRLMTTDPVKAKRHLRRAMILDGVLFLGAAFSVALATTVAAPHG